LIFVQSERRDGARHLGVQNVIARGRQANTVSFCHGSLTEFRGWIVGVT